MLLPLPPQKQPNRGCGQSPEFCDPRSGGELGSFLVLWVAGALAHPQQLSPGGTRGPLSPAE